MQSGVVLVDDRLLPLAGTIVGEGRVPPPSGYSQKTFGVGFYEVEVDPMTGYVKVNEAVQVHDIGKEKGEYFFAMEYVHGEDLRKLLMKLNKRKEKVPFEHVVTIVTTAALALHHAHEQRGPDRKPLGLVHRDVSPANIIVGYDGNVKVVDFGIAKAALRAKGEDTKAGALKGKVSYMSPEQCAGQSVDRRGDVYSLGIVLFEADRRRLRPRSGTRPAH